MNPIETQLCAAGLSAKEAAVYLALLQHGTRNTSFVAKKAGLNRGTTYLTLHSLVNKGLAAKSDKAGVQSFTAQPLDQVIRFLELQEEDCRKRRENLVELMPQLTTLLNPLTSTPKMQLFEGAEGARAALEDTLKAESKLLQAFLSIADMSAFIGPEFFDHYTDRRIKKGYTLNALRTYEKDKIAFAENPRSRRYVTSAEELREIRYVSEDLAFPVTIYIYDDRLCIISSKQEGFAAIIESGELAQMQRSLFCLLWVGAKPLETADL